MPYQVTPDVDKRKKSFSDILSGLAQDLTYQGDAASAREKAAEVMKTEAEANKLGAEAEETEYGLESRRNAASVFDDPRVAPLMQALIADKKYDQIGNVNLALGAAQGEDDARLDQLSRGAKVAYGSTKGGTEYKEGQATQRTSMNNATTRRGQDITSATAQKRLDKALELAMAKGKGPNGAKAASASNGRGSAPTASSSTDALIGSITDPDFAAGIANPRYNEVVAGVRQSLDGMFGGNTDGQKFTDTSRADERTNAINIAATQMASRAYAMAQARDQGRLTDQDFRVFAKMTGLEIPEKGTGKGNVEPRFSSSATPEQMYRAVKVYDAWENLPEEERAPGSFASLLNELTPEIAAQEYRQLVEQNKATRAANNAKAGAPAAPAQPAGNTFKSKSGIQFTVE